MKAISLIILQFTIVVVSIGQTLDWHSNLNGFHSTGMVSHVDQYENSYITCIIGSGPIDFDPDTSNSYLVNNRLPTTDDMVIAKYDSSSNLLWARTIGGSHPANTAKHRIVSLEVDPSGNLHLFGDFEDTLFFGPSYNDTILCKGISKNAYWASYDPYGNLRFVRHMVDTVNTNARQLVVSNNGDVLLYGYLYSQINLDFKGGVNVAQLDPNYMLAFYLALYDSNGNLKWKKTLGYDHGSTPGQRYQDYYNFWIDPTGNILYSGEFLDSMDVDPDTTVHLLYNSERFSQNKTQYIAKLDSGGNMTLAKTIQTAAGVFFNFQDYLGDYRIFGKYTDSTDLNPDTNEVLISGDGLFVADFNSNLNYIRHFSSNSANMSGDAWIEDLSYNSRNEPVAIGSFHGTQNFLFDGVKQENSQSGYDVFVIRCKENFANCRTMKVGVNSNELCFGGGLGADNSVYIGSSAQGGTQTDIEPGPDTTLISWNSKGWWIGKYKPGPYDDTTVSSIICHCDSIFLQNAYRFVPGLYVDSLFTYLGGDSLVFTNLSIDTLHITPVDTHICLGDSIMLGAQYRKIAGLYNDTLSNFRGCDSILAVNLIIDPLPNIDIGPDLHLCDGDSIYFDAADTALTNYRWNGTTVGPVYSDIWQSNSSDTMIWLRVKGVNGCFNNDTLLILDNNIDSLHFTQKNSSSSQFEFTATYLPTVVDNWRWNFGDGNIHFGDTSVTHQYTTPGYRTVCLVAENECDLDSTCQGVYIYLGVEENEVDRKISVYPNPVDDKLNVVIQQGSSIELEYAISDLNGKLVKQGRLESKANHTLDLSDLKSGSYYLRIFNSKESSDIQFIKE